MLAKLGEAFDSDKFLYEVKWDGTRTLAFIESGNHRLINRRGNSTVDRYPELAFLQKLPRGTVLDGEIVVLKNGQPDFGSLLSREQVQSPLKIHFLSRSLPATYIVFDLLYESYCPIMDLTLEERRDRLSKLIKRHGKDQLVFSEGFIGKGTALFAETNRRGLEGVVAKRLGSIYHPGARNGAWIKFKKKTTTLCAVIGFLLSDRNEIRSLLVATEVNGELRYIGRVGTGIDRDVRDRLKRRLNFSDRPIVPCRAKGRWIPPGVFCKVSYLEATESGELRAPVLEELYV
jgi:DNA ligase D-like protein (predicted ligase)